MVKVFVCPVDGVELEVDVVVFWGVGGLFWVVEEFWLLHPAANRRIAAEVMIVFFIMNLFYI